MSQLIDGKYISQKIREQIKHKTADYFGTHHKKPGLATILVGESPASKVYIRNKIKACEEVGIISKHYGLPETTTQSELLELIHKLNHDSSIQGILVQLPVPKHIDSQLVLDAISPLKDVDGFHPMNMGNLLIGKPGLKPCTPYGVMKMLEEIGVNPAGLHAVIVGRSNIVGKPMALLLLQAHATVTLCHSKTKNIAKEVERADIVVAAVGIPHFVKGEWIQKGAIVIDVGINRLDDGRLVGDVDFAEASKKAAFITPVPGGVGPMTIAMLLWNTLEAAQLQIKKENL
ncbi:MAG: hypothetical protein ACD_73C00802G0004 [uncultured bacterium]|nr:MAG: hypothetical protein ACD_73C00802G0004 [uncultured bacterium]